MQPPIATSVPVSSLWHKDVPLKVALLAWWLFRDRLPTKDSLFRRDVLNHNSMGCVTGCSSVECPLTCYYIVIFLGLSAI